MSDTANMIKAWLGQDTFKERIDQALMGYLPGDAFAEQCIMVARDPKLSKCSADSLLAAFLQCAQLGLMPGAQKHVVLMPRGGQVDVMITARGFKALMERLPDVSRIKVELVHKRDTFEVCDDRHYYGRPLHKFDPFDPERLFNGPEDLAGGYMQATFEDGSRDWFFVSAKVIDDCKRCAKDWQRPHSPWQKWFAAMAVKTIYRQAWARMFLPMCDSTTGRQIEAADLATRAHLDEHYSRREQAPAPAPAARALTYDDPAVNEPPQLTVDPEVIVTE